MTIYFMKHRLALELRQELEGTGAEISYLGPENHHENNKPWSDTCEKEAVCSKPTKTSLNPHT